MVTSRVENDVLPDLQSGSTEARIFNPHDDKPGKKPGAQLLQIINLERRPHDNKPG